MKSKNVKLRKLLNVALLGAICAAPMMSGIAAKAAPPNHDQKTQNPNNTRKDDKKQDSGKHADNQNHGTPPTHATNNQNHGTPPTHATNNQNHGTNPPHATNNQNHGANPPHATNNQNHGARPPHATPPNQHPNWQRTNNNSHDDNWHRSHGYVKNGSSWNWHGHDDAWWINNGYGWNGSIWLLLNSVSNSYGPFQNYNGIVTRVDYGNSEFDLRVNGTTYNVYANRGLQGGLSQGDLVRVYGQRYGNNDIRNANFRILRNR